MNKLILSITAAFATVFFAANTFAQTEVTDGPKIEFSKETHDYGEVAYGGNGTCTFEFKNTGNAPLIISNARGSCGCTVPEWPKDPIAPGKSGVITVKYDTKRTGAINKSVTITSNAVNEPTKIVRIKGNVGPNPAAVTPAPAAAPASN
jgi:hypothetical protein